MKRSFKKGFTLAELLIVIAIIAALIAIMLPVFGAQLNKATAAAELANVRAKYAELLADDMLGGTSLTDVANSVQIKISDLAAVAKTSTSIVLDPVPNGTNMGKITVTYAGISGSFEIDEDVEVLNADGTKITSATTVSGTKS